MRKKNNDNHILTTLLWGAMLCAAVALPLSSASAASDPFPAKPVRMLIAFAPGGSTDIIGRLIATKLSERLGKPVVVENRSGAGGSLGAEVVAKSDPDGYTLLFTTSAYATNPLLAKAPYDPMKSFVPIAKIGGATAVLTVHPSVPANNVKELIALAKKQPGKLLSSAAGGGSFGHLATELFRSMADIDYQIVQFKGGGPAMMDTIGGHSQIVVGSLALSMPQIKAGKLKALGYGGLGRSRLMPELPTIHESGVPGYEAVIWWGLFAPAGTPKPVTDRIYRELQAIVKMEDMQRAFDTQGADMDIMGSAEFTKFIQAEMVKWGKLIKDADIKLE